ncbi:MAG: DUF1345 domain-containing protein [Actinobacteria bacterium]|nr:DUF1345 domain-containing protein [Actinomycetota bacterium]
MAIWRERMSDTGVVLGLAVQFLLIVIGVGFILAENDDLSVALLFSWCALGTAYASAMIVALWLTARPGGRGADLAPRRIQVSPVVRVVGLTASVVAATTGVLSAVLVLLLREDPELGWAIKVLGAWAMLLAWGLLHWGYAQWYFQLNYAAPQQQFAFRTTFATSDVDILTRRVRWTVTVHAVSSFFFNGAIIVLALNTIIGQA